MKTILRTFAFTIAVDDALVERAGGPGTAPTAFRVWAAGENMSDDGPIVFSQKSAKALMAEQEARGRLYSSDFDHLSLQSDRPATSGRASGWHRLEVREDADGAPELWAVDIEWCADAKEGLEEQPPRWRYFSPAFNTTKGGEVTSYMNFALCINPLTHNVPSLASATSTEEIAMKHTHAEMKAAHAKAMAEGATDEEKATYAKMMADFFGEDPGQDDGPGEGEKKEKDKETTKEGQAGAKTMANNGEDDKHGIGDEAGEGTRGKAPRETAAPCETTAAAEEKTEAKAAAAMAQDLVQTKKRLAALEIKQLLDDRKDLPESIRTWCMSQPIETVKSFLTKAPKQMAARESSPTQGGGGVIARRAANGLQGKELEEMNRAMGIRPEITEAFSVLEDGRLRMNTVRPSEWRKFEPQVQKQLAAMRESHRFG